MLQKMDSANGVCKFLVREQVWGLEVEQSNDEQLYRTVAATLSDF